MLKLVIQSASAFHDSVENETGAPLRAIGVANACILEKRHRWLDHRAHGDFCAIDECRRPDGASASPS
jgi:hypothetical protein